MTKTKQWSSILNAKSCGIKQEKRDSLDAKPDLISVRLVRGGMETNKTHICVNLGFYSGISSCEWQNFAMMKSQLSFVDCFTASRGQFRSKNCGINA